MKAFKSVWHLAVALALTAGLVGCGTPGTASYATRSTSSLTDMSDNEAMQIKSFNDGGLLDLLPLEELEDEDFGVEESESIALEDEDSASYGVMASGKTTKIGYVRSIEDGKFFLQVSKGIFKKKDLSFPLVASTEDMNLKLGKLLNKRVILRGKIDKETITPTRAFRVPTLNLISTLLNTGKIKGKVFNARTMQTLDEADVTARSLNTGRLYRIASKRDGSFSFCAMPPGDYTLEVSLAGYARNGVAKVTVQKRKVGAANVGLNPAM